MKMMVSLWSHSERNLLKHVSKSSLKWNFFNGYNSKLQWPTSTKLKISFLAVSIEDFKNFLGKLSILCFYEFQTDNSYWKNDFIRIWSNCRWRCGESSPLQPLAGFGHVRRPVWWYSSEQQICVDCCTLHSIKFKHHINHHCRS